MDIIEFVEKCCGVKLLEWQKEYLRRYKSPDESEQPSNQIVPQEHDGLRTSISFIDEWGEPYKPVCPRGYIDCICDPAYIQHHCPEWYKKLYGDLTPTEALYVKNGCYERFVEDPDEEHYCYDEEDK